MNSREYDKLTIEAVKKVAPCVVSIVISKHLPKIKSMNNNPFTPPFIYGFGPNNGETEKVQVRRVRIRCPSQWINTYQ